MRKIIYYGLGCPLYIASLSIYIYERRKKQLADIIISNNTKYKRIKRRMVLQPLEIFEKIIFFFQSQNLANRFIHVSYHWSGKRREYLFFPISEKRPQNRLKTKYAKRNANWRDYRKRKKNRSMRKRAKKKKKKSFRKTNQRNIVSKTTWQTFQWIQNRCDL